MKSRDRKGAAPPAVVRGRELSDMTVRRRHLLAGLGLCLLTLAAYSNSFDAGFAQSSSPRECRSSLCLCWAWLAWLGYQPSAISAFCCSPFALRYILFSYCH